MEVNLNSENAGLSDRFFHNSERPMPRGWNSDENRESSLSTSGILRPSRSNSPASKPSSDASPGLRSRPIPRGMTSSSSTSSRFSSTRDYTSSNLSHPEFPPERADARSRYDEKLQEDIGHTSRLDLSLQDGTTKHHASATRIHQETSFYSPFRINNRSLNSFQDRPGSTSSSLFSVTNLPVSTSQKLLSQSIKSSRDTREKYYLNSTIRNAISPRRLVNKSSAVSATTVAATRERQLYRSYDKEETKPAGSTNVVEIPVILTVAEDTEDDNFLIPTTRRSTVEEDTTAKVQETLSYRDEEKEVETKHQELRPEASLPAVSRLCSDVSTPLVKQQQTTTPVQEIQPQEQVSHGLSLSPPSPVAATPRVTTTCTIRDISNFNAQKRETWYNFRTKVRKCFCELDDMIEKHRDLFKSDPATGLPSYDTLLAKEAEDLAKKSFETLEVFRQRFKEITQEFATTESSHDPSTRTKPVAHQQYVRSKPMVESVAKVISSSFEAKDEEEKEGKETQQEETKIPAPSVPAQLQSSSRQTPLNDSQLDQSFSRIFNTTFDQEEDMAIPITPERLTTSHLTQETPPFNITSSNSSIGKPTFSPMIPSSIGNRSRHREGGGSVHSTYRSTHGAFDDFDRRMEEIRRSLNVIAKGDKTTREIRDKNLNFSRRLAQRKEEAKRTIEEKEDAFFLGTSSSSTTSFRMNKSASFPRNRYDEELETSISMSRSRGQDEQDREEEDFSMNFSSDARSRTIPNVGKNDEQGDQLGPSNENKLREILEKLKGITEEGGM